MAIEVLFAGEGRRGRRVELREREEKEKRGKEKGKKDKREKEKEEIKGGKGGKSNQSLKEVEVVLYWVPNEFPRESSVKLRDVNGILTVLLAVGEEKEGKGREREGDK